MGVFAIFTEKPVVVPGDLGGELPPVDPGGGLTFVSIFDDTTWDITDGGIVYDAQWHANGKISIQTNTYTSPDAQIIPKGNWYVDFRPTRVRVTLSDIEPGDDSYPAALFGLNDHLTGVAIEQSVNNSLNDSASKTIWTSNTLQGDSNTDIEKILLADDNTQSQVYFWIVDIEFEYDTSNPPDGGGAWPGGAGGEG